MLKLRSVKTVREYYDNAVKKDSTKEKGEEKRARKTIREYLYRYVQDNESGSEDLIRWNKLYDVSLHFFIIPKLFTLPNERNEELVALLEIDENELDYTSLNNLMKINVNNPGIIDPISADFDEIIERISKLEQKLSIEKELHFYVTGLQRLKFLFKNIVLVVGDRRICAIEDLDLYKKIVVASRHLMKEYKNKVPLSITCPGKVEGKNYILATVNLPRGTPVYNLPVEYNAFPVIVDYGAMKASTSETSNRCHEYHENLKPGISISDSKCYEAFTLGKLFTAKGQSGKKYLLTVNHGVGENTPRCATVTKYIGDRGDSNANSIRKIASCYKNPLTKRAKKKMQGKLLENIFIAIFSRKTMMNQILEKQDEKLGALIAIDENKLDYTTLHNFIQS
ncbi:hypothetical protein RhiirA5_384799 [Rhizophagus irregularis]|uniref:Uncharacterized protein n=1 Tax=Rhizophagus irregularis TaxID=588596 RepID=A0A2N0NRP8_9GLOM|nr:hypothetical protein RhiirA5_384799 [Rhizophagus irregularis]